MYSVSFPEQPRHKSWNKKALPKILLLLFSLLICGLIAEAILRISPSIYHGLNIYTTPYRIDYGYPNDMYLVDKMLGYRCKPNFRGFFRGRKYKHIPIHINSMGFRDREYSLNKPAGVFRILGIGDSVAFGAGVRVEDVYLKQLEVLLNKGEKAYLTYEAVNAGIRGYDNLQELRWLKELAPKLYPDLVLIGFTINDICGLPNNNRLPSMDQDIKNRARSSNISEPLFKFRKHSKFIDLVIKLSRNAMTAFKVRDYLQQYQEGCYQRWQGKDWELLQKQLLEFKNIANEHRFQILFILFPTEIQLNFTHKEAVPQVNFIKFAQTQEILYLDLFKLFKENYLLKQKRLFLENDNIHLNPEGHRLIAEATYNFLHSNKLLKVN